MAERVQFKPSLPRANILQRLSRKGSVAAPLVVWVGAIVGVWFLLGAQPQAMDYGALATVHRATITAPVRGRIEKLMVARDDVLESGQLIGRLDGNHLELRARTVRNRVSELRAEIERENELYELRRSEAQVEQDNEQRRFQRDVENARLDALEVIAKLEENRIRLEGLKIDLARQKKLTTKDLFSEAELIRTRIAVEALGERIKQSESSPQGTHRPRDRRRSAPRQLPQAPHRADGRP